MENKKMENEEIRDVVTGVAAHEHGTFQRLRDAKRYIFKA